MTASSGSRPGYTVRELEEETGFDRRTIAYYIQEGLLPRVGRRGPRTRYPKLARDRLHFITRVREAEESGEVAAVSLSKMRTVFERAPAALIARVADGRLPVTMALLEGAAEPIRPLARRYRALEDRAFARALRREREAAPPRHGTADDHAAAEHGPSHRPAPSPAVSKPPSPAIAPVGRDAAEASPPARACDDDRAELAEALRELRSRGPAPGPDLWARIRIAPGVEVSLRGVSPGDGQLLQRVGRALRRLIAEGTEC